MYIYIYIYIQGISLFPDRPPTTSNRSAVTGLFKVITMKETEIIEVVT